LEYRQERKGSALADEKTNLSTDQDGNIDARNVQCTSLQNDKGNRHRISRVIVTHDDISETFYDKCSTPYPKNCASEQIGRGVDDDDFFDKDSFWSGSITWY